MTSSPQKLAPVTTRFERDLAITARIGADFLSAIRSADPAAGASLEEMLGRGPSVIAAYETEMRTYPVDSEDLAEVLAMYFAINWAQAQGRAYSSASLPTRAQFEGLCQQVAPALAVDLKSGRMPAHHVQEMADTLIHYTLVQTGTWNAATRSHEVGALSAAYARQFEHAFGLDLALLDLTGAGFEAATGRH